MYCEISITFVFLWVWMSDRNGRERSGGRSVQVLWLVGSKGALITCNCLLARGPTLLPTATLHPTPCQRDATDIKMNRWYENSSSAGKVSRLRQLQPITREALSNAQMCNILTISHFFFFCKVVVCLIVSAVKSTHVVGSSQLQGHPASVIACRPWDTFGQAGPWNTGGNKNARKVGRGQSRQRSWSLCDSKQKAALFVPTSE